MGKITKLKEVAHKEPRNLLVTGGAGFIGSHVVRHFATKYPHYNLYNLDILTYAANLVHLSTVASLENYHLIKGDITHAPLVQDIFRTYRIDGVIHLAAETHVDRSIEAPLSFVRTNVLGTSVLLEAARLSWQKKHAKHRFYHTSTDEVYGPLGEVGAFREHAPYRPQSPYAASKASADHLVRAYGNTYQLPFVIGHPANNYGPCQFQEKFVPLIITHFMQGKPVPVYADGRNIRNWLYVTDHIAAIDHLFHRGEVGASYNIGGGVSLRNREVLTYIATYMEKKYPAYNNLARLVRYVADRKGHDYRYAMHTQKIRKAVAWRPLVSFEEGIARTVDWYLAQAMTDK